MSTEQQKIMATQMHQILGGIRQANVLLYLSLVLVLIK